jgi:hypothetical protein
MDFFANLNVTWYPTHAAAICNMRAETFVSQNAVAEMATLPRFSEQNQSLYMATCNR